MLEIYPGHKIRLQRIKQRKDLHLDYEEYLDKLKAIVGGKLFDWFKITIQSQKESINHGLLSGMTIYEIFHKVDGFEKIAQVAAIAAALHSIVTPNELFDNITPNISFERISICFAINNL